MSPKTFCVEANNEKVISLNFFIELITELLVRFNNRKKEHNKDIRFLKEKKNYLLKEAEIF